MFSFLSQPIEHHENDIYRFIVSVLAVSVALIINTLASLPFMPSVAVKEIAFIGIIPGGAAAAFTTGSLSVDVTEKDIMELCFWYSLLATLVYIVIAYITMYIREDVFNLLDRVCS